MITSIKKRLLRLGFSLLKDISNDKNTKNIDNGDEE